MATEQQIIEVGNEVINMLVHKNAAYGDSALNPIAVFGHSDPIVSLGARIDDKLSRIRNRGVTDETEDTISDLIGYLILYKLALQSKK
jgi:hypothetical protein